MPRIRLLASCLAGPGRVFYRGHERDVDDATAAQLLATHQWELVQPPAEEPKPETPAEEKPEANWTDDDAALAAGKAKRAKKG